MPKKTKSLDYYSGIGRRKRAVAQVRLYLAKSDKTVNVGNLKIKTGEVYINGKTMDTFFGRSYQKEFILLPLKLTKNLDRFAVSIHTRGGGLIGQMEAIIHGLSRAIEKVDRDSYRPILKEYKLLTRDPRKRERRKVGTGGKARRLKQSPKR
jgi:small subunit ribosomal protein S9